MPKGRKIDAEVLEPRRLEARRLLDEGVGQAEVARRLKILRQSVSRWTRLKPRALARVRRQGRKSTIDNAKRRKLRTLLLAGPLAAGFANELWTVPRVRRVTLQRFRQRFSTVHVWRLLRQLEFSPQRSEGLPRERDEAKITAGKTRDWPRLKKARRERRTLPARAWA
jgi:transposase